MPKFIDNENIFLPMSGASISFASGTLVLPTGDDVPDVENRLIDGISTDLEGECKIINGSGMISIARGTTQIFLRGNNA